MMRWLALAGVAYMLGLFVFWSLMRVSAEADASDLFDLEPDLPPRPCPLCTSSNVYVDTEDVCFCVTCRASYRLEYSSEAP